MSRREDRQESFLSKHSLEIAGTAAAALGSVAFFHKTGQIAKYSRVLNKSYRKVQEATRLTKKALEKDSFTISDMKRLARDVRTNTERINKEYASRPIEFSGSAQTLVGHLLEYRNKLNTARNDGAKAYKQQLVRQAYDRIVADSSLSKKSKAKLQAFAWEVVNNIKDPDKINHTFVNAKFNDQQILTAIDIRKFLNSSFDEDKMAEYQDNAARAIEDLGRKTIFNKEYLKRNFSKKKGLRDKVGDEELSVGKYIDYKKRENEIVKIKGVPTLKPKIQEWHTARKEQGL